MPFVERISELRVADVARAGGKGANLGELTAAGAPVPGGFVVLADAWRSFLEATGLESVISEALGGFRPERATEISDALQVAIGSAGVPEAIAAEILAAFDTQGLDRVAVRSSATAEDSAEEAWAGQLDTYLDVRRENLLDRVRACWASLLTPRAIRYRAQIGMLKRDVAVAVVVQEMVVADRAGVGFSVHPTTQESDVMYVESAFGLGEALVSGEVTPDAFALTKTDVELVDSAINVQSKLLRSLGSGGTEWVPMSEEDGGQPSLDQDQVTEYGRILERIESHYGFPVDTEWVLANGAFHVVQSRPITTLDADYTKQFFDRGVTWASGWKRPWSLFDVSLWGDGLASASAALEAPEPNGVGVEFMPGMCSIWFDRDRWRDWLSFFIDFLKRDIERVLEILQMGIEVNERTKKWSDEGTQPFATLDDAYEEIQKIRMGTVVVPFMAIEAFTFLYGGEGASGTVEAYLDTPPEQHHLDLRALAERNRAQSSYPYFEMAIFPPLLSVWADEHGLSGLESPKSVLLVEDVFAEKPDLDAIWARVERLKEPRRYVWQIIGSRQLVHFVDDPSFVLARLAGARVHKGGEDDGVIRGSSAYPGEVEGTARVVLKPDDEQALADFEEGDILISSNANPSFMPFICKAAALVTDEGGASCHAAIVARELRKPSVIGTGNATSKIPDGSKVHVDAVSGEMRVVE